ncbi:MAG: hypothetical protein IT198_14290 [Acidimicrobiia bacterium]|nr:hypothetical protein [Acidimicrobiia bacterium]
MCDHCGCRNFAPIAELTAEHEEILRLAWEVAESGDESSSHSLPPLLAALDMHVRKEEAGLYPLLTQVGRLPAAQLGSLEADHADTRTALARGEFGRNEYYALAAHIEEEEIELFSAARFTFEEDEWEHLEEAHRSQDPSPGLREVKDR